MKGRIGEVARIAGVKESEVLEVTAEEVRDFYSDRASWEVVEVATQTPAFYWKAAGKYYLDDAYFGPVIAIDDLDYNSDIGLHIRK